MLRPARSLRWRLLAATVVALGIALALAGLGLHHLFREHVMRQFEAGLSRQLDEVTTQVNAGADGTPRLDPQSLTDPRWQQPLSGLYWQVDAIDAAGTRREAVLRSRSLWDTRLLATADGLDDGQVHRHEALGPRGQTLMLLERTVLPADAGTGRWRLMVAADLSPTQAALADFARVLTASLAVLLVLLAGAAWAQVAVGLQPLRRLQRDVQDLQAGRVERLGGGYPEELEGLVKDFNRVLDQNRQIVERARTQAGNLAHALKTPLAVLEQIASQPPADGGWPQQVQAQVALAQRQVEWHLARARLAAAGHARSERTQVAPAIEGLVRVLLRAHGARDLAFDTSSVQAGIAFAGAPQDLQEILGNLMDNACKWARSQVQVSTRRAGGGQAPVVEISVDDDGPGIDPQQADQVLARGVRLDETVAGSGLGLAIVHDAVKAYGGSLGLERSPLGGLRARVILPACADYS